MVLVLVLSVVAVVVPVGAIPAGLVGVPSANVSQDFPAGSDPALTAADLEGSVMASQHAESLEVIVTTSDRASDYLDDDSALIGQSDGLAIVLRDDVHDTGREVAIDAAAVRQALGYVPERVYGTHENGEEWSSEISYEGGLLVFDVPHFSTNTVTFSGSVTVTATPAVDGSSYSYDMDNAEAASAPNVTFTGALSAENDTETFSSLSDGGTGTLSVAGTAEPTGPSANNEPEVTITGVGNAGTTDFCAQDGCGSGTSIDLLHDGGGLTEIQFTPSTTGEIADFTIGVENNFATNPDASIHVDEGAVDGSTSGEQVDGYWAPQVGDNTISVSGYKVEAGQTYHIEIETGSSSGGAVTTSANFGGSTGVYENGDYNNANPDVVVAIQQGATDPAIDLGNDGSTEVSISGSIGKGASITRELPSLDTSTSGFAVSATAGAVDVQVDYSERTTTNDPSVTINGNHTLSYSGSLAQGESVTLSGDSAWIDQGVNNVTVSTASASADAPEPAVKLNYTHSAVDQQVVDYTAEKWSERYNVSKTYASDRTGASVTIPFADEVMSVSSVESRTNGGSWSSVTQSNYDFDGTTLTVDVGDVASGDSVEIRTTARKVSVINGSITVLQPTAMGSRLDSKIRVESWSDDAYISMGGSPDGQRIHYAYEESWSDAADITTVTASGYNRLYLPNAAAGSEARVSTIPLRVNAQTNEVRLEVTNPSTTSPSWYVRSGDNTGDTVEYTFLNAQSGQKYRLMSVTNDVQIDSAEANSPVTLVDESDEAEELQIELDDSTTSSTSGDSSGTVGIGPVQVDEDSALNTVPVVLIVAVGLLIGVAFLLRRFGFSVRDATGIIPVSPVFASSVILIGLVVIEFVSGGQLTGALVGLVGAGEEVVPLAGIAGIALGSYWFYQRFIVGEKPRPIQVVTRGGNN
jgi:hypothetical protein